ncbi:MAG: hypothetical protein ACJASC_003443 [Limimaricola cinnabarinus]|jgi:hypothetical protein
MHSLKRIETLASRGRARRIFDLRATRSTEPIHAVALKRHRHVQVRTDRERMPASFAIACAKSRIGGNSGLSGTMLDGSRPVGDNME